MDTYKATKRVRGQSSAAFLMVDFIPSLKPALDILFEMRATVVFAEFLIILSRATAHNFSARRMVGLVVCALIFVICFDWYDGFNFFKNVLAPFVWNLGRRGKHIDSIMYVHGSSAVFPSDIGL
jgi:hypothetical protein